MGKNLDTLGRRNGRPLADRFWERVNKSDGCWLWTGGKSTSGYGQICVTTGRIERTHRVSWFLATGEWPPSGLHVCHHCDTPTCVRPDHLFLGTHQDNMRDMVSKGRSGVHKDLSDDEAKAVRELHVSGVGAQELAARFEVSDSTVQAILTGQIYKRAGGPTVASTRSLERLPKAKLTWAAVDSLRAMSAQGVPTKELARRFGISEVQAYRVVAGTSWVRAKGAA